MTAEESQDAAFEAIIALKAKQRADRATVVHLAAIQAQARVDRDAAYNAFLDADQKFIDAQFATFTATNVAETEDVVAIYKANMAYQQAVQNHGFVNG